MADYLIEEVCGFGCAEVLHYLNAQEPETLFPRLKTKHLEYGYWWLARTRARDIIGFAGIVPMTPFSELGVWYLKRAYVVAAHRGNGLQTKFLSLREAKAREFGWKMLIAECGSDNATSASNFIKAGFSLTEPEQKWGAEDSIYFVKRLTA